MTIKFRFVIHMFNVKLVTSLPKIFQWVLSHSSQLDGKNIWFLGMTSLKGDYQFYSSDARIFSWLHRIKEAWNDFMKVSMLETLYISVNKKFKKVGVRFILLV